MSDEHEGHLAPYIGITFALSVGLSLAVGLTGGAKSGLASAGLLAMLFPAVAVLALRLTTRARMDAGWRRFPWRWIPVALFVFPLVIHVVNLPLIWILNDGLPWARWLTPASDGLYHPIDKLGWPALDQAGLVRRIALNAAVGILVVTALAFFEEIGWRAWMLPRLAGRLGVRRGAIASAVIWALWHLPFSFSGLHQLEGLAKLLMPLAHFGAGLVLAWLWLATKSIWIVSLAHGSLNNWGQYAFKYMDAPPEQNIALLTGLAVAHLAAGAATLVRPPSAPSE